MSSRRQEDSVFGQEDSVFGQDSHRVEGAACIVPGLNWQEAVWGESLTTPKEKGVWENWI